METVYFTSFGLVGLYVRCGICTLRTDFFKIVISPRSAPFSSVIVIILASKLLLPLYHCINDPREAGVDNVPVNFIRYFPFSRFSNLNEPSLTFGIVNSIFFQYSPSSLYSSTPAIKGAPAYIREPFITPFSAGLVVLFSPLFCPGVLF